MTLVAAKKTTVHSSLTINLQPGKHPMNILSITVNIEIRPMCQLYFTYVKTGNSAFTFDSLDIPCEATDEEKTQARMMADDFIKTL